MIAPAFALEIVIAIASPQRLHQDQRHLAQRPCSESATRSTASFCHQSNEVEEKGQQNRRNHAKALLVLAIEIENVA